MLSTFQTFQLYSRDTTRIMQRIEADPVNKRDIEYYRENISKVETVDDLMSDYRLYSYALTAHGLAGQIDSPGLIRKVLESDIEEPLSLVNKLGDDRYRDFYKSFDFRKSVDPASLSAQTISQTDRTTEAYSEHRIKAVNGARQQLDNFEAGIQTIQTVDDFLNSDAIFKTALSAVGIDPAIASKSFIRDVFVSDAADGPASRKDTRFVELKALFNFQPDGTVAPGGAQSKLETNETIRLFYEQKDLLSSSASASNDIDYWNLKIGSVTTADEFTQDRRLMDVALRSVGIDADIQDAGFVWKVLTSDPNDPNSTLNAMSEETEAARTIKDQYKELRTRFNFATDGTLEAGATRAVSEADQAVVFNSYLERNSARAVSTDRVATSLYKVNLSTISTVSQFVKNKQVFEYALKAFGIDPGTASRSEIVQVLRSDPGDPASYARKSGDERFVQLAAAFNFDDSGKIAQKRTAQTDSSFNDTLDRFTASYEGEISETRKLAIGADAGRYREALANVVSVTDFVENKTLADFVTRAFNIEDLDLDSTELAGILTSDLDDPESLLNEFDDERLFDLRFAFQFNSMGGIDRSDPSVQSNAAKYRIDDLFLRQKFEEQAGAESEGARLALYFKRSAGDIKNPFDILADPALLKVVQTAIGLPAESGQANIDTQARLLRSRVDFESFKDPEGLSRFIDRFVALYDIENGGSNGGFNPASILLGGGGNSGALGLF